MPSATTARVIDMTANENAPVAANDRGAGFNRVVPAHDTAESTAPRLTGNRCQCPTCGDKETVVLYVGDRDPSGRYMAEVDIQDRLTRYGGDATIVQVALLESDCSDLPSFDVGTKRGDPRQSWYIRRYGTRCWELDALPPPILRQRVEDEIAARLDFGAWQRMALNETAERASMAGFLRDWHDMLGASKLHPGANCDGEDVP